MQLLLTIDALVVVALANPMFQYRFEVDELETITQLLTAQAPTLLLLQCWRLCWQISLLNQNRTSNTLQSPMILWMLLPIFHRVLFLSLLQISDAEVVAADSPAVDADSVLVANLAVETEIADDAQVADDVYVADNVLIANNVQVADDAKIADYVLVADGPESDVVVADI